MKTIVVSDLHIGSRYFLCHYFESFVGDLPKDYELVLNGDIVESPRRALIPPHQRILDLIVRESYDRKVIWVRGNHDNGYSMKETGRVSFSPFHALGRHLLIFHGDDFDEIMPRSRCFMKAFKLMYGLRVKLGARPVHVAHYAKKWKTLYQVFRHNVMMNAVKCARQWGYQAIACGHTHYPEDIVLDGIRYINTGAWTETPVFYLLVNDEGITLKALDAPGVR